MISLRKPKVRGVQWNSELDYRDDWLSLNFVFTHGLEVFPGKDEFV